MRFVASLIWNSKKTFIKRERGCYKIRDVIELTCHTCHVQNGPVRLRIHLFPNFEDVDTFSQIWSTHYGKSTNWNGLQYWQQFPFCDPSEGPPFFTSKAPWLVRAHSRWFGAFLGGAAGIPAGLGVHLKSGMLWSSYLYSPIVTSMYMILSLWV